MNPISSPKKTPQAAPAQRGLFCNRTLNLRNVKAIGYDMDYTLIHYHVEEWERQAFEFIKKKLVTDQWPVEHLIFDPNLICRGIIIDTEQGNLIKADRFGFVRKALHGTKPLEFEKQKETYSHVLVDLAENRWIFLNTLFSLSEGCMYAQLVELFDQRLLPRVISYSDLYQKIKNATDAAHMEGDLKRQIISNPDRFVVPDPEVPLALLDQKHSGKKLMLITNSEWNYTLPMMAYAIDRHLPPGVTWRELFDIIIVGARKPEFFTSNAPFFEVVTEEGLLKPVTGALKIGTPYLGGNAQKLSHEFGISEEEILYVGDHMFGDVRVSKNVLRWRTALILRELEEDIERASQFASQQAKLSQLMLEKNKFEDEICAQRIELQRMKAKYGNPNPQLKEEVLQKNISELRQKLQYIDQQIAPLAKASSEVGNPIWGQLMRAGNDKSHLARQIERYADIYTSRVSNFLYSTPFMYLRAPRGSLPHDIAE